MPRAANTIDEPSLTVGTQILSIPTSIWSMTTGSSRASSYIRKGSTPISKRCLHVVNVQYIHQSYKFTLCIWLSWVRATGPNVNWISWELFLKKQVLPWSQRGSLLWQALPIEMRTENRKQYPIKCFWIVYRHSLPKLSSKLNSKDMSVRNFMTRIERRIPFRGLISIIREEYESMWVEAWIKWNELRSFKSHFSLIDF